MKRYFLSFFCGFLAISFCYGNTVFNSPLTPKNQTAFQTVEKQLSTAAEIRGQFKQTRHMRLLSEPLISYGTFTLQKTGLHWQQTQPFPALLTVTNDTIKQTLPGAPPTVMTAKSQPVVFSFTKIFLSVFKGDTQNIRSYFDIYFSGDAADWQIGLKPKPGILKKAIRSITLAGSKTVREIRINQTHNNQMEITFSHVTIHSASKTLSL